MRSPTNEDIVLAALLALGADIDLVDIEDVAVKADEIAPGRFRWRKYTEQINIQAIYKALKDSRAHQNVRGTSAGGWMLSDEGLRVARSFFSRFSIEYKHPITRQDRTWATKERKRLATETAYLKLVDGDEAGITQRDALRFFMLDEYVTGELRKARIDRLVRLFSDDDLLSDAVRQIAQKVPQ